MPKKTYRYPSDADDEPSPPASEPVYLPGASENEPAKPWAQGWPQQLVATEGDEDVKYWRLRDGTGSMGTGAESTNVIYGKILRWERDIPVIEGNRQYLPTGKTSADLIMAGGAWYAADDLDEDSYIRDLNYT